jgi:hypothetical protein
MKSPEAISLCLPKRIPRERSSPHFVRNDIKVIWDVNGGSAAIHIPNPTLVEAMK